MENASVKGGEGSSSDDYGSDGVVEDAAGLKLHAPLGIDSMTSPPLDPRQTRSPLLFSSQAPTIPLLRNGSIRLRQNDSQGSAGQPFEQGTPIIITWSLGGNNVTVEGSWDNWKEKKTLQRAGKDHSILLVLATGIYHYNFYVDGEMRYIPHLPSEVNEKGCTCNVLEVTGCVPDNLESVSEFEAPSSPDSSYIQSFLDDDDFDKDPAGIPPQLQSTILDSENCKDAPKPQHVVLNHLLVNKTLASQSVIALGTTHRFQSKYVTVVLFKPAKRLTKLQIYNIELFA